MVYNVQKVIRNAKNPGLKRNMSSNGQTRQANVTIGF